MRRAYYDEFDGAWLVVDEDGRPVAGPFADEQEAADWIEAFGDDA